jgi:hypothetical protein
MEIVYIFCSDAPTCLFRKLLKQNIFDSCNLDLFYHILSAQGLTLEAMDLKKGHMFYSFSSNFPPSARLKWQKQQPLPRSERTLTTKP